MGNARFIHSKTKETFNTNLENGLVSNDDVVFIDDTKEIYSKGNLYKTVNWSVIENHTGDVIYWDGERLKCISYKEWDSSLGIAKGILVIPSGGIGYGRMIALEDSGEGCFAEGIDPAQTITTQSNSIPILETNGDINISTIGLIPSDSFKDLEGSIQSEIDKYVYYSSSGNKVPSPFKNDWINKDFITGVFSKFDGDYYTKVLSKTGEDVNIANIVKNYPEDLSITWYVPTATEMAYAICRKSIIDEALQKVGGSPLEDTTYWTSIETTTSIINDKICFAWSVNTSNGEITYEDRSIVNKIRPFATYSPSIKINPLILFTLSGIEYKAELGMDFGDWVSSKYNTGSFKIKDSYIYTYEDIKIDTITIDTVITSGGEY